MPQLMPIELPAGFYRHGVELESLGRWRDGNFVRWERGSIRPVGGWRAMQRDNLGTTEDVTVPEGVPNASHGWIDNASESFIAVGTNDNLYATGADLTFTDITPVGFAEGIEGENLGYGGKAYGKQAYGVSRIPDGTVAVSGVWSMDNWGENWVGCNSGDRKLYEWDLVAAQATEVTNAPPLSYMVVTAERFVFALQADGNPRKIAWCDREDIDNWTPEAINQAGDIELVTKGSLQGACRVRGRTLILTEYDAFIATYQGPPVVYGFQKIGSGVGLASPRTLVTAGSVAAWMGSESFFMYDGSTAVEIPCDVQDAVFLNINKDYVRKAWGVANEKKQEIWWFFPSSGSLECDRYVAYDYGENHWLVGWLNRGTGIDVGVYKDPIWFGNSDTVDTPVYRHESGNLHGGVKPFLESGPIMLETGQQTITATNLLQDELVVPKLDNAEIEVSFDTTFWADSQPWVWGPYPLANPTNIRLTGRQLMMRIEAEDGKDFRIGGMRLEYEIRGRR